MILPIYWLSALHCCLIILSNCLVQFPFVLFGMHITWGTFTYPLIFVITDLTTRILGASRARLVIFYSMFPGLIASYFIAHWFNHDPYLLWGWPELPLRIGFASFSAYVIGQLLDISIFSHIRRNNQWWVAPLLASSAGNFIDTVIFFTVAFYQCQNPYLNQYWVPIAITDLFFKILITLLAIVPLYGIILTSLTPEIKRNAAWL